MSLLESEAIKAIEREFGIRQQKELSAETITHSWSIPSFKFNRTDVGYIVKDAMLSATTSPFLRAIVVMIESENTKEVMFLETKENSLSRKERIGSLLNASEKMKGIKEIGSTHLLNPSPLIPSIFQFVKEKKALNIHILNIHHDYIRSFYKSPIETTGLIWKLMDNSFQPSVMVIRNVREEEHFS